MTTTSTVGATSTSSTATNAINSGLASVATNYQTFLSLLTTQLKNQDPLSPLDTNQFTQQLTQMTGVEQQLLSNQLLQQLVTAQSGIGQSANLIGKVITAPGANTGDADITGVVSAVQQVNGATVLTVGSNQVALSSVTKVASDPNNPFAALSGS
ncbi:MAG TPA: flagellar hook capping FlgD N-terminal domain-containing protein [Caulobacteraceae bacterium]